MKTVSNWLIVWTGCLLRHPKLLIMVPVLSVFLLSYPAVYDFTLAPLNGVLLTLFDDCVLSDGSHVFYQEPGLTISSLQNKRELQLHKVSLAGVNALKYDSLKDLSTWVGKISKESVVFSPTSLLPESVFSHSITDGDKKKVEKCFLKVLNHDLPRDLFSLLFDKVGKQNHVVNVVQIVNVFVWIDSTVPLPTTDFRSMKQISQTALKTFDLTTDNSVKTLFQARKSSFVDWLNYLLLALQATLIIGYSLRVYLSVCNSHKIRSNVGLVIGWLNGVLLSIFAAISLFPDSSYWTNASGPGKLIVLGFHLLGILIMSSRTLFRTVNDMAGDSNFAEPESLHKRLVKFYLGFNSSIENSSGVFHVSSFIRRTFKLDSSCHHVPIPSTTIIFLINLVGLSAEMVVFAIIPRVFMDASVYSQFLWALLRWHRVMVVTQIIDHLLQLTYVIAIIIIDLRRIDLTDVLEASIDDPETITAQELNPFSAQLLASSESKFTFRHRLGTYLLKLSPYTPQALWSVVVPLICGSICVSLALQVYMVDKDSALLIANLGYHAQSTIISHGLDALYYVELASVVTLILIISELVFTYTYSVRQRQDLDACEMSDATKLYLSDLSNVETTPKFEAFTSDEGSVSEKMKLFANPKASILVSTDLDHRVVLWSPSASSAEEGVVDISTTFEGTKDSKHTSEFWPVNHVEISNEGDFIMLVNNRNFRIKCYSRQTRKYEWEISLTSELTRPKDKMKPVLTFFRKKTVAGFFARELLLRRNRSSGKSKRSSNSSLNTMHGNFPPPLLDHSYSGSFSNDGVQQRQYEDHFNREEFVMILETGQMITVSCDSVKIKVYNLLSDVFSDDPLLPELRIQSSKFLTTSRINDRVVCNISNGQIVVGSAINNVWRFSKLKINKVFVSNPSAAFASPSMARDTWAPTNRMDDNMGYTDMEQKLREIKHSHERALQLQEKFSIMNESTIVTIDFVGMFVRVLNLQAELIDIQTGTVLKLFHIGSFKPGTFRVSHSEPTHCKFCGCVSFETMSLIYEDLYNKTVIVHTFRLVNKKSRNNICLRVERDPLEIRCLGFDAVVESQYWFNDIEMWDLTDMNVIVGIKKVTETEKTSESNFSNRSSYGSGQQSESVGLSTLRNRKQSSEWSKAKTKSAPLEDKWQGFVITASDGKLLDYNIPMGATGEGNFCTRPNLIIKFGFKAVAIAFGHIVKIIYLGNDKLVENDLYYSGSASTLDPLLRPGSVGANSSNELLFINKRRKMMEKKFARSNS